MKNNNRNNPKAKSLKIIQAGAQPPCLQSDFGGFCRGCFGWENMINAALNGDPTWNTAQIHCSETNLTVTNDLSDDQ